MRLIFCKCFKYALSIIIASIFSCGYAQEKFSYFNISNQLLNNSITTITQDKYGFVWIGTRGGGFVRFDGYEIKQLRNDIGKQAYLQSQSIEILHNGKNDIMWIGTKSGGLSSYNFSSRKITNYINENKTDNQFNADYILSLLDTDSDKLLIGTWKGFEYFNKKTNSFTIVNNNWKTFDIQTDGDNGYWLGTNSGLRHLNKNLENDYTYTFNKKDINVSAIVNDKQNNCLWLGTWGEGLIKFDLKTKAVKIFKQNITNPSALGSNNTYRLLLDTKGNLWVGTWGGGLNKFDIKNETFEKIELSIPGLFTKSNKVILTIHEDASGILWIGTDGAGIFKYNLSQKKVNNIGYSKLVKTGSTHVTAVYVDPFNKLWLATKGGSIQYSSNKKEYKTLVIDIKQTSTLISPTYEGRSFLQNQGFLWIATTKGLLRVKNDNNHVKNEEIFIPQKDYKNSIIGKKLSVLAKDSSGRVWIGTQENGISCIVGYDKLNKPIFKNYLPAYGKKGALQNERVNCILVDSKKRIWIGTYKGLHLYDSTSDSFKVFLQENNTINSISNNTILSLAEDKFGQIWVGTQFGLNKLKVLPNDNFTVQKFTVKDGLISDYIHAVLADKAGNIWASTNKGIVRISQKNQYQTISILDKRDGVVSDVFSENASFASADGKFYFGGIEGLTYFNPDSILINNYHPPIYFTNLKINNKPFDFYEDEKQEVLKNKPFYLSPSITLNHWQNIVSIEFASLDFNAPDKNEYMYQLEGFNKDWVYTGNERLVSFTNLSPGNYTLKVKATNSDKIWSTTSHNLQIKILPPPWKTWWAYCFYVAVFIFLLWLSRYFSLKQIQLKNQLVLTRVARNQERELADFKERLFTNISHEFRTPLTLILGPLEDLLQRKKFENTVERSLRLILKQSKRMLRMVNQLLDFQKAEAGSLKLNLQPGEMVSFCYDIFLGFKDEAQRRKIDFTFNSLEKYYSFTFDYSKLEIIIVNILGNAFKFTPNNESISFTLRKNNDGACEIIVKDTGKGIEPTDLEKIFDRFYRGKDDSVSNISGTGIGLSFVKELVSLHGGTIHATSDGKKGSIFTMVLPQQESLENSIALSKESFEMINQNNEQTINSESMEENTNQEIKEQELPIILVVDDEVDIQQYVYEILAPSFKVLTASNGKEGIEIALETIPDLIVSDIMMPEVDGLELCKTLKSHQSTSHIPIILLTALSDMTHHVQGIREGADVYLPKPFNSQLLLVHIHNLITSRNRLKDLYAKKILLGSTNFEVETFEEEFIAKVMKIVEENISNSYFSSDELANLMFMSRSTFYRKLKAVTGISGNEFVRSARLNYAAKLLQSGKYSVTETAYEAGFNDIKYFRKRFQDHFGVSPSDYKK